jgi:hypothetical protein
LRSNIGLHKSASCKIDELKTSEIRNQQKMVELQSEQLQSFWKIVKTEMQLWSDIALKNCTQRSVPSVKIVRNVVKTVVEEENRSMANTTLFLVCT